MVVKVSGGGESVWEEGDGMCVHAEGFFAMGSGVDGVEVHEP